MISYVVGANLNNTKPAKKLDGVKRGILIIILLILIVGYFTSFYFIGDAWMRDTFCKDRMLFPATIFFMLVYTRIIIWFSQYPFRDSEFLKKANK